MKDHLQERYLDLVKRSVLGLIYEDEPMAVLAKSATPGRFDRRLRENGLDWPARAHSMIGLKRMDNVQACVSRVIEENVPGDLIETGVWRGGTAIFMRAMLWAYGVRDRRVWLADSFAGLPPPDPEKYPLDQGVDLHKRRELAVSQAEVKANFARYDLLDEQVRFLPGWFRDTLPQAPCDQLAVLRLDGDLYESTIEALTHLYPRLAVGGYVIIDDYGALDACREAVDDYRVQHRIADELQFVDWSGAFWRRC